MNSPDNKTPNSVTTKVGNMNVDNDFIGDVAEAQQIELNRVNSHRSNDSGDLEL